MTLSIKNKRLRREVPLLPYETKWQDGDNVLYIPLYSMKITVTDWYPFRFPKLVIDGVDEADYIKLIPDHKNKKRITEQWCPSYGIREFVDDFLQIYGVAILNNKQATLPPDFSNSLTFTSTTGL
jgi:hypothetical protein